MDLRNEHDPVERSSRSVFLSLPYELRQRILREALHRDGTCHMQTPVWGQRRDCLDPLFEVCRSLRDEALEAFYKTNMFVWYVNIWIGESECMYSDPTVYPLREEDGVDPPLTPALPWNYPHFFQHLRKLNLRVKLPARYEDQQAQDALSYALTAVVKALDFGRRLQQQDVYFVARIFWGNPHLDMEAHQVALQPLTRMEVPGRIRVAAFPNSAAFNALGLQQLMKAPK